MTYKWYIIQTTAGTERTVEKAIRDQVARHNMSEYFGEIVIPVIEVIEVKRGKEVKVEKKLMPGYIFLEMNMTDSSWRLVTTVPKVSFLGSKGIPKELNEREVQNMLNRAKSETEGAKISKTYEVGESVVVTDDVFEGCIGVVEEVDNTKNRLKLSISIFGKATPMELNFNQVKKRD